MDGLHKALSFVNAKTDMYKINPKIKGDLLSSRLIYIYLFFFSNFNPDFSHRTQVVEGRVMRPPKHDPPNCAS